MFNPIVGEKVVPIAKLTCAVPTSASTFSVRAPRPVQKRALRM
jgi:hypothetical protein